MAKASDSLSVGRAFGPPYEKDGVLVIPVAWVAGGGGGGGGPGEHAQGDGEAGSGSGGGFGGVTWPLGAYVVKDGDVRWVPAIDMTRLLLAAAGLTRIVIKGTKARRSKS
jgi:uncharacterized spore protein YtfJ